MVDNPDILWRGQKGTSMKIQALGYDPEVDELDLLIDVEEPVPAETIPVDAGIYIRRDPDDERVVGAMIRGYAGFLRKILEGESIPATEAKKAGFAEEFDAIIEWQTKAIRLSHDLLVHLGASSGKAQYALVETLLTQAE